jgi:DUF1707 SHOCT-like domain
VDGPQPEIRVGDRERRAVDDRLRVALDDGVLTLIEYEERAALCWAARTRGDLDALVRDLPPPQLPEQPTETLPAPPRAPVTHKRVLGAFGAAVVVGAALLFGMPSLGAADGMSLFGSRQLSVTDQAEVEVGVLFGSVDIVVPDDVRVRTGGTIVFGSLDCAQACSPGTGPQREVAVHGSGAFGSVDVVRQSERDREAAEEAAEDAREQREEREDD